MFILEVTNGPHQGQCVRLQPGQSFMIGRSVDANLSISDSEASNLHARFSWDEGGFSIEDSDSTNGTFINGSLVKGKQGLKVGDFVQVGKTILVLKQAPPGAAMKEFALNLSSPMADKPKIFSAKTMMAENIEALLEKLNETGSQPPPPVNRMRTAEFRSLPEAPPLEEAPILSRPRTSMAPSPIAPSDYREGVDVAARLKNILRTRQQARPYIVVQFCDSQIELDAQEEAFFKNQIYFGRGADSDVLLPNDDVSVTHFSIERRETEYWIRDEESSNGTYLNDARCVEQRLQDGDVISLASYRIQIVTSSYHIGLAIQRTADNSAQEFEEHTREQAFQAGVEANRNSLGVVASPSDNKKKKKKKASDLVWFATSDLDRGVFRARSALLAILFALITTGYMLATGDSVVLAGGALAKVHESPEFLSQAESLGYGGCNSCHMGVGQVSTLKCITCHETSRPQTAHVNANLQCTACHKDHQGETFSSAAHATISCVECHAQPHENLLKLSPQLVQGFSIDAPADSQFHLKHHIDKGVSCASCHGELVASGPRGVRSSCGQCHAPEVVSANQCQQCHFEHPDQEVKKIFVPVPAKPIPRFQYAALMWLAGLIILPLGLAALIPRQRKVNVSAQDEEPGE